MKKVAIIGQTLNKNHRDKLSGGIQTVERLHVDIFLEQGWEVHFIAPSDSEKFRDSPDFSLHAMQTPSEEFYKEKGLTKHEKGSLNRAKAQDMRESISLVDPDLIINHSFSSSHVRLMAELSSKYPIMNFVHNTPDTAMDIGYFAKLQHYLTMTRNGGSVVNVTRYCRDLWRTTIKKRVRNGDDVVKFITEPEVDDVYTDFCYPVYITKPPLEDRVLRKFVVITRMDPIKNLHGLLELMLNPKVDQFNLEVYFALPGGDKELYANEYFVNKVNPLLTKLSHDRGWNVFVHQNVPREELLKRVSESTGNFVPCPVESASITFLEAASYGLKSVVFGKERDGVLGHAAVEMLGEDNLFLLNSSSKKEEMAAALDKFVKSYTGDLESREKLQQLTSEKHSFSARMGDIMAIAEKVMGRYTKPKTKLMEF